MEISFVFTQAQVERFASLTGDFSPIHVNAQFARRSRYRRTVVHGMLPVTALAVLGKPLRNLRVRFIKPVFPGDEIQFSLEKSPTDETFKAKWTRTPSGEVCTEASGELISLSTDPAPTRFVTAAEGTTSLVAQPLALATLTASEIKDQTAMIEFCPSPKAVSSLTDLIQDCAVGDSSALLSAVSAELASACLVSSLIGMKLPGQNATFTDLELTWGPEATAAREMTLIGRVEKFMAGSARLQLGLVIQSGSRGVATGRAWTLVQSGTTEISAHDIRESFLDLGLNGRTALVIGASRGIGAASAKTLALLGARVGVHYFMGESDAAAVVQDIQSAGGQATALHADIRDPAQVTRLMTSLRDQFGEPEVLVNCAVGDFEVKAHSELEWDHFLAEFEVSLRGMHACCQAVIPGMKARGRGKIIHLSTVVTQNPVSGQNKYITTKAAIEGYSRSLATELASSNIQVNLVLPGMTETSLLAGLPKNWVDRLQAEKASGKILQPIDVARAIAFLASEWSTPISGGRLILNQGESPYA